MTRNGVVKWSRREHDLRAKQIIASAEGKRRYRRLQPTPGVHDVYVVFRNDQVTAAQLLFVLLTATFESGAISGEHTFPR